ncbi:MAG: hypothetical protein AMXMBFR64_20440 [Myxococcales bacterium]
MGAAERVAAVWLSVDDPFLGPAEFGYRDGLVYGGRATRLRLLSEHPATGGATVAEARLERWWATAPAEWSDEGLERPTWLSHIRPFEQDRASLMGVSPRDWIVQTALRMGARSLVLEWGRVAAARPDGHEAWPRSLRDAWVAEAPITEVAEVAARAEKGLAWLGAMERLHRDAPATLVRLVEMGFREDPHLLEWALDLEPESVVSHFMELIEEQPQRRVALLRMMTRLARPLRFYGSDVSVLILDLVARAMTRASGDAPPADP